MRARLCVISIVLAVLGCQPRAEHADESGAGDSATARAGRSPGHSDTMHVYVHNVRASKELEYERWVHDVWMPAVEKAGQRYSEVRQASKGQRLFAPTKKQQDSSANYVWVFEPAPPRSVTTDSWIFPDSFLVAGGYSPRDAAAQAKALWRMVSTANGGEVVRKF